jgi:ATP-dependent DNA helicase RecG
VQNLDPIDKERFKKLGVVTLLDLALLIPHHYENTTLSPSPLLEQINTLHVRILSTKQSPKVFQIIFDVPAWQMHLEGVIFAVKPYHKALFKVGSELYISGKVQHNGGRLQMVQPQVVTQINTLIPKYKTPLQNKTVMGLMQRYLSEEALEKEGLNVKHIRVLQSLHFPTPTTILSPSTLDVSAVLKYVEIFNYLKKLSYKKVTFPSSALLDGDENPFIASLPFTLTHDQQKVIVEIKQDFLSENAAKRVIMGDVGCGKTMVILSSVVMAYPHKSILMAPTTVLARQLFEEAKKYLPLHVRTVLVTQDEKEASLEEADFIIGTHALLYRELPECALVMVDEQHRFGTKQRALLASLVSKKAWHPHYLQFSATPIPRTLSMIQSSLVDFSFIKMLPFPKDIMTSIVTKKDFKTLVEHLKAEIAHNHQCIIVYPLVEESEMVAYQSIDEGRGFWEKHFEKVYVTHGKDKNKEETLHAFKEGGNLLISTTVVEVGLSLPNLSTIVIVGAERLGLASLHQLRGRVSRNGLKGYCYLYTNLSHSERLSAFSQTLDGFEIAELDLKYRQGGDVVEGAMQSGKKFLWFDMVEDEKILEEAKRRVEEAKMPPLG